MLQRSTALARGGLLTVLAAGLAVTFTASHRVAAVGGARSSHGRRRGSGRLLLQDVLNASIDYCGAG